MSSNELELMLSCSFVCRAFLFVRDGSFLVSRCLSGHGSRSENDGRFLFLVSVFRVLL
jgi:hypothetical protein